MREVKRRLLDVESAAEYLGVARKTLYKWVESGQIPFVRMGRLVRFRESDLVKWVESRLQKSDSECIMPQSRR